MSAIGLVRIPGGSYVAVMLPGEPDGWNGHVAALRVQAAAEGVCPECSAPLQTPSRAERRAAARAGCPVWARMHHDETCPAGDRSVIAGEWRA